MPLVLTNGKIKVGAYRVPDRKKIAFCVEKDNHVCICGYFTSKEHAEFLMNKIGEIIGQKEA